MRVKLSYTVEEENVLKESAKILGLASEDMQQTITLFQGVQTELISTDEEVVPNISLVLEMIDEFRTALLAVDTRLVEVSDIIQGYDDYKRGTRKEALKETTPDPNIDHFGTD